MYYIPTVYISQTNKILRTRTALIKPLKLMKMHVVYYASKSTVELNNWAIMTRPGEDKLSYDDHAEFWPFQEKFLTYRRS